MVIIINNNQPYLHVVRVTHNSKDDKPVALISGSNKGWAHRILKKDQRITYMYMQGVLQYACDYMHYQCSTTCRLRSSYIFLAYNAVC